MFKYIMNFKNKGASALFEFNNDGHLVKYELSSGNFDERAYDVFFANFPINIKWIDTWKKQGFNQVEILQLKEDLSFEAFYNKYNHKVSKKSRAEKIWETMNDTERAKAIAYIAKYERYLLDSGVNKKYPETYLNSQLWNN